MANTNPLFADIVVGPLPSRTHLLGLAPQEVHFEGIEAVLFQLQSFPLMLRRGNEIRFSQFIYTKVADELGEEKILTCYGQTVPKPGMRRSLVIVFLAIGGGDGRLLSSRHLDGGETDPWPYFDDSLTLRIPPRNS